jgi:hypothetical protein
LVPEILVCVYGGSATILLAFKISSLFFPNSTDKIKTGAAKGRRFTNSNSPGPIELSSQSISGIRQAFWFAF